MTRPEEKLTPEPEPTLAERDFATAYQRMWKNLDATDHDTLNMVIRMAKAAARDDELIDAALASVAAQPVAWAVTCSGQLISGNIFTTVEAARETYMRLADRFPDEPRTLDALYLAAPSAPRAGEPTRLETTVRNFLKDIDAGESPDVGRLRLALTAARPEPNTVAGTQPGNGEACAQSQPTVPAAAAPEDAPYRKATHAENLACLYARLESHLSPGERNELTAAIRALRPLAPAQIEGWIPVEERLPEQRKFVLGYSSWDRCTYTVIRDGDEWLHAAYAKGPPLRHITHWQSLPADPRSPLDTEEK